MFDNISFDPSGFVRYLPHMGEGMLCILIVIGVLILFTALLNRVTKKHK